MDKQVEGQLLAHTRDLRSSDAATVSCSVCQHEIPLSAAISREASDYVEYYCGLECFERWRDRAAP